MRSPHLHALQASPSAAVTVMLVETHELLRRALTGLLEGTAGAQVTQLAENVAQIARELAGDPPEVLVLGLNMTAGTNLQLIAQLHERNPRTRIVVLSHDDTPELARRALAVGASGYVLKDHADAELADAVISASRGGQYTSPLIGARSIAPCPLASAGGATRPA